LAQAAPDPIQTSRIRQLTAERMALSARTVAPVTLTTDADASLLVRLRDQAVAEGGDAVPSYTDLLIKVAALALTEHPSLNGDHTEVNIAFAVDTDSGLLAPVVSGAARPKA